MSPVLQWHYELTCPQIIKVNENRCQLITCHPEGTLGSTFIVLCSVCPVLVGASFIPSVSSIGFLFTRLT